MNGAVKCDEAVIILALFGLGRGGRGGKMPPLRVFAKYLKNGLANLNETF